MTEPAQLLLICALGTAAAIAGLLGVPPSRRASGGLRRRVLRVIPLVSGILRGSRSHGGGEDELRGSAEVLLHQYASLLQSGRSQAQAWADLSSHWRSRDTEHPLTQVCVLAAAAEQAGLGAVVGLRRSLDSLSIRGLRLGGGACGLRRPLCTPGSSGPVPRPALRGSSQRSSRV